MTGKVTWPSKIVVDYEGSTFRAFRKRRNRRNRRIEFDKCSQTLVLPFFGLSVV